jgi:hypothetical protein
MAGRLFALDWKNFPNCIQKGDLIINADAGFRQPLAGDLIIPPLSVSVDYAMGGSATAGAVFSFYTTEDGGPNRIFLIAAIRVGYHPDLGIKNLDVYANLEFGFNYNNAGAGSHIPVFYCGNIGARYFLTKNIGIYAEASTGGLAWISSGITVKF